MTATRTKPKKKTGTRRPKTRSATKKRSAKRTPKKGSYTFRKLTDLARDGKKKLEIPKKEWDKLTPSQKAQVKDIAISAGTRLILLALL